MSIKSSDNLGILFVQMGGTIDKDYPKTFGGYAFEIGKPASKRILMNLGLECFSNFVTVCQKDSQDIVQADMENLIEILNESKCHRVVVTHGTDTMLETAKFVATNTAINKSEKVIIFTGALKPESFKNSDADFNLGTAIGAVQSLKETGVYIAMNGRILKWNKCRRHPITGHFVPLSL